MSEREFKRQRVHGASASAHQGGGGGGDADESCAWAAFSNRVDAREQQGVQTRVLECVFAGQNRRSFGNRDFDKLPGPQPASLSRSQLETLRTRPYAVLEKSDGERCMLYVGADKAYLIDRKFCCRSVDHGVYALALGDERGSLLDGEMITGGDGSTIYLIYDIVQFCGNYVGGRALPQRLEAVHAAVDAYFRALGAVGDDSTPFALKCKTFLPKHLVHQHLAHIAKLADGSYQYEDAAENLRNQNDGLIFTPEDEPYLPSSNQLLLKWKWPDLNSIDFKVTHPYFDRNTNNLQLQCGYNGSDITIRSIALDEGTRSWLEHHLPRHPGGVGIVECVYDANLSCWLVKKFRPDKNSGNYISTVMSTLETVIDNVTPQEICTACGSSETYAPAAAAAPVAAAASSLPAAPLSSHAPMARALVSNHAAPPPPPPQSLPVALRASMPSSASFSFAPQPPSP